MQLAVHLDVDLVAVKTADQVSALIELTAPAAPASGSHRPACALQVVLDRSGSMSGGRLDGAKTALIGLIDRLDAQDKFGLVTFDRTATVVVPTGNLTDKQQTKQVLAAVTAGSGSDLSAGYLRGLQEVQRVVGATGATVVLISDGRVNRGITDPDAFIQIAAAAHSRKVTTSTLGCGLGYDQRIMSAIARGGAGRELFAEQPDAVTALIVAAVDGLLPRTAHAVSLLVRLSPHATAVRTVNDLPPASPIDRGIAFALGSFYADEARKLFLTFDIPAITSLGRVHVATLELAWTQPPSPIQHISIVPLHVNVIPRDAASSTADAVIRTEPA